MIVEREREGGKKYILGEGEREEVHTRRGRERNEERDWERIKPSIPVGER
jgi:hypothetical protein